jgi:hypothetical protein
MKPKQETEPSGFQKPTTVTMNRNLPAQMRPMILVFVILNALFIAGHSWLTRKGLDQDVLIIGNLILFLVFAASFWVSLRSFDSASPNVSVRAMYMGFIIKFFVVALAALVYIMITKKNVNKTSLITCMGLYIIYTYIEVGSLVRILKKKKNA